MKTNSDLRTKNRETQARRRERERAWLLKNWGGSWESLHTALMRADPKEVAAFLRNIKTDTHRK